MICAFAVRHPEYKPSEIETRYDAMLDMWIIRVNTDTQGSYTHGERYA